MATKITYHQVLMAPNRDGDPEPSVVVPHSEAGWIQVFDVDFVGGGTDKRFLIHLAVIEPITDEELRADVAQGDVELASG